MIMRKILYILTTVLALTACTRELEVDMEYAEPEVVVMSCMEPDSLVRVNLSYSRYFLAVADDFRPIENATVRLEVNGTEVAVADSAQDGRYLLNYRPTEGDRLRLRAHVPGHDEVSATTVMPRGAAVSNMRIVSIESDGKSNIRFTLHDPADEDNYYLIRVIQEYQSGSVSDNTYCDFSCNDYMLTEGGDIFSILESDGSGETFGTVLAFPDDNIAGTDHEVSLKVRNYRGSTFYVEIVTCSRDYYLYEVSSRLYDDDPFSSLFSEPVQIHSNISGGIGIFGARSRKVYSIPSQS